MLFLLFNFFGLALAIQQYTFPPWGFRTSTTYEVKTGEGVNTYFPFNITADDIKGLAKPALHIKWKKELQGKIWLFIEKDNKPSFNENTVIDSTNTCLAGHCWSDAIYKNLTAGTYWMGFAGNACTECSTQKFFYVTPFLADGDVIQPFLVTANTTGYTPTYTLGKNELQDPYAMIVLENTTDVYVKLKSFQDFTKALVSLVFKRGEKFVGTEIAMPTKETDDLKSYPHPGGSEVSGEWDTGAYRLGPGTWYVAAVGGNRNIGTDFQLSYNVGHRTSDAARASVFTAYIAIFAVFLARLL